MAFIGVKLSNEDKRKLEELTENKGMTVSELIRDMIRNGYEQHSIDNALQEIRSAAGSMVAHKGCNVNNQDLTEIKRIVTLIARAMPAVARQMQ